MSEVFLFAVCPTPCVCGYLPRYSRARAVAPRGRKVSIESSRELVTRVSCAILRPWRAAAARGGAQSAVLLVWSLKHHKAWPWTVVKSMNSFFKVYIMNYTREVPSCDKSVMSCCCRPPRPGE